VNESLNTNSKKQIDTNLYQRDVCGWSFSDIIVPAPVC